MSKGLFERIAALINGNQPVKTDENVITIKDDNSINKKGNLINAIIHALKSNYAGSGIITTDKALQLLIEDGLFYDSLVSSSFKEDLTTTINDELGFQFGSIDIIRENTIDNTWTQIMDKCYLSIRSLQVKEVVTIAHIYPVEGKGSLINNNVCLDSLEIKTLPGARYNIGIGKHPLLDDRSIRDNQIAIDDDPNSTEFENNKFVSRAHANITYSDAFGFLLNVEHGGTRASQKRTHIHRAGEIIELNNSLIPEPLCDGDYIVLSKHVYLLFKKA